MAEDRAALARDISPLLGRLLGALAVLLGVGLAALVWRDGTRGLWLQIATLGEFPPLVNNVPFLWTIFALFLITCLALFLTWIYVSGEFDRPVLGLLAFAFFADVIPGILQFALLMVVLILAERGLRRGDVKLRLTPLIFPLAWLAVAATITFLLVPKIGASTVKYGFRLSFLALVVILPAVLRNRRHVEILFHYLLLGAIFSATVGILQHVLSIASGQPVTFATADFRTVITPFGVYPRCTGLMLHPNHQANALGSVAMLALFFALRPAGRISPGRRIYYLLAYFYLWVAVILSWSRSGWLALMVATALLPILRWPRLSLFYLVLGGLAAYVGYTTGVLEAFYEWVKDLNASSADFRWRITQIAARAFWDHPWFGVGMDQMVEYNNPFNLQVHNTYLQALSEMGLFGSGALLCIVVMIGLRTLHRLLHNRDPWHREWLIGLSLAWSMNAVQCAVTMFLWQKFIWALVGLTETILLIALDHAHGREETDTPFLPLRPSRRPVPHVP